MKLKDKKHLLPSGYPFVANEGNSDNFNAFLIPNLIHNLKIQFEDWVRDNRDELLALLEEATSRLEEPAQLQFYLDSGEQSWLAVISKTGIKLVDPQAYEEWELPYKGEEEITSHILAQVIGDPVTLNILNRK